MIGAEWWRRRASRLRVWRESHEKRRARNAYYERLLRQLPIPLPFEAHAFCDALAVQRGRPIVLVPFALGGRLYGLVASGIDCDYIVYESDTTALHQNQTIMHEACHLILNHRKAGVNEDEVLSLAQSILGTDLVRHVLGRGGPTSTAEVEAEELASHIIQHAVALQTPGQILAPSMTETLTRLRPFYTERGNQ